MSCNLHCLSCAVGTETRSALDAVDCIACMSLVRLQQIVFRAVHYVPIVCFITNNHKQTVYIITMSI